mmetsp:Transcript_1280/g.1364  ORF Transcript_1280/g.1364 Transcript_1280/m.1364 type:complete len:90 (-) Transcript_1280:116-385(-)
MLTERLLCRLYPNEDDRCLYVFYNELFFDMFILCLLLVVSSITTFYGTMDWVHSPFDLIHLSALLLRFSTSQPAVDSQDSGVLPSQPGF